jgi:hypothetical protein
MTGARAAETASGEGVGKVWGGCGVAGRSHPAPSVTAIRASSIEGAIDRFISLPHSWLSSASIHEEEDSSIFSRFFRE